MKKVLAILAAAAFLAAACQPKTDDTPAEAKSFGVSPVGDVAVEASATSLSISIESNINWTAESDNDAFTVSPASGNGNGNVTVSFPANEQTSEVSATISIVPEKLSGLQNAGIKTVTVKIIQAAAEKAEPEPEPEPDPTPTDVKNPQSEGLLAQWEFCTANLSFFEQHFAYDSAKDKDENGNYIAGKPGYVSDDHYCESTSGNGRIRMLNVVDKSTADVNPKGVVKRGMGNYGEPCFYGPLKGDIVNIYAYPETPYDGFAAGTKVHIFFALRPNTKNTPKYWILEVKDGADWAPVGDVKTTTVAEDGEVKYNIELIFNPDGQGMQADENGDKTIFPDVPQQINTFIDQTYTFKSAVSIVEYRLVCASNMGADGVTSAYPLSAGGTAVLRFAGKDSNSGGAHPVEDPMKIEIVK